MAKDKKTTVRDAVIEAMSLMPPEFSMLKYTAKVRELCGRPYLMDTSISATMRRCRAERKINFECIDIRHAIYQKYSPGVQTSIFDRYSKIRHA